MAGRIITVAQQKGGAGKTTLAAHLSVAWSEAGRSVAVIDIDPQGSLTYWMEERAKALNGATGLTHSRITGWRTQNEAEKLARNHDLVVIDSPPHAETEAKIAIRIAHLVVVPIQPSPMDLWATAATIEIARQEKIPSVLVLNRVPPRGKITDVLIAQIEAMVTPPLVGLAETRIGNRLGYAGALYSGRSVTELEPRATSAEEITALSQELLGRALGGRNPSA